jgi:Flp pilus assembly protein TadD
MGFPLFQRTVLLVVAGVVLLWLSWGLREVGLLRQGDEVIELAQADQAAPADIKRGRDAFRDAGDLTADQAPHFKEGFLLLLDGQAEAAVRLAREGASQEPENFNAWYLLYIAAQGAGNSAEASDARRKLGALNPLRINELNRRLTNEP